MNSHNNTQQLQRYSLVLAEKIYNAPNEIKKQKPS